MSAYVLCICIQTHMNACAQTLATQVNMSNNMSHGRGIGTVKYVTHKQQNTHAHTQKKHKKNTEDLAGGALLTY
jgi:hypothetical protein